MFIESAKGFLFIGDPHVSSKRIGRRRDDYQASVLQKLSDCADLCLLYQLVPVILGDLFHRNDDNNLPMLNGLMRVLKKFPCVPVVLEGNHDKEQTQLSPSDALDLMQLAGVVRVASKEALIEVYNFEGRAVRLWACPYGSQIPDQLPAFEGTTILLTHHDLAFGSSYPGSQPLKPIANCDMVVNGHMHDTKACVLHEQTWWHNPGNIEPLSVDLAAHVPRAWEWTPEQDCATLTGHDLSHGNDLFDLTGLQVVATDSLEAVQAYQPVASQFAQLLRTQSATDAARTDDATILLEDLNDVFETATFSEAATQLMQALATEMVMDVMSS